MGEEKKEAEVAKDLAASSEISFEHQDNLSKKKLAHEEISIEDLHQDLEKRLQSSEAPGNS